MNERVITITAADVNRGIEWLKKSGLDVENIDSSAWHRALKSYEVHVVREFFRQLARSKYVPVSIEIPTICWEIRRNLFAKGEQCAKAS